MADNRPIATQVPGQEKPLLTKTDLQMISRHILAAVNPLLDVLKADINSTRQQFQQAFQHQQLELTRMKGTVAAHEKQIRMQAEEIRRMKAKQDREERSDRQKTIIVQGLEKENPTEHFLKTVKEKLDIDLKNTEFSLETKEFRKRTNKDEKTRRQNSTSGNSSGKEANQKSPIETKTVVTVTFSSVWRKREVYSTRAGLRGTNVFLSEDLSASQRAIFFKCRELRRKNKIKSTWTHDLKIWIRDNNDQKTEITTESDLDFIVSQSEPLPPPPPPLPPTDTRTVPETPYTTPRPSPARSLSWSEESLDSFHGFGTEASLGNLPSNPYWLYLNDRYTFQLDIQHICVPFICQTDAYTLCFHFHFVCIFMFIFPKLAFFNRKLINHGTDVNDGAYFASNHG